MPKRPDIRAGLWTTCHGESLHESLRATARRDRARGRSVAGVAYLPGAVFTDGDHMYEVIYGCQGLGEHPAGWVVGVRTDHLDDPPKSGRPPSQLFMWSGRAQDGIIKGGRRRAFILRLVRAAPRLEEARPT